MKQTVCLLIAVALVCAGRTARASSQVPRDRKAIPVILDTDIGDDIDDTWALGLLLKSPELDVKLVVGEYGKADYRAKVLAKFLQTVGRTDVPVGIGLDVAPTGEGGQASLVKDFRLNQYSGRVIRDGVQALIDTIMHSRQRVTVIVIGPMSNLAEALSREPRIAQRADIVGMDGSVRLGYGGNPRVSPEWNIKANVKAAQQVFSAPWHSVTITPLDTCGLVGLDGDRYRRVKESKDPIAAAVVENYRVWSGRSKDAELHSTTLYDTVAVYLAIRHDLCKMERLNIRVTDDGFTVIDPGGKPMQVATAWNNLDAFRDYLVGRLTGK